MSRTITLERAWLLAADWGSYMHSGDPGAVMYSLSEHTGLTSEEHRERFLAYVVEQRQQVEGALAIGEAKLFGWTKRDAVELAKLERWARYSPLTSSNIQ